MCLRPDRRYSDRSARRVWRRTPGSVSAMSFDGSQQVLPDNQNFRYGSFSEGKDARQNPARWNSVRPVASRPMTHALF